MHRNCDFPLPGIKCFSRKTHNRGNDPRYMSWKTPFGGAWNQVIQPGNSPSQNRISRDFVRNHVNWQDISNGIKSWRAPKTFRRGFQEGFFKTFSRRHPRRELDLISQVFSKSGGKEVMPATQTCKNVKMYKICTGIVISPCLESSVSAGKLAIAEMISATWVERHPLGMPGIK